MRTEWIGRIHRDKIKASMFTLSNQNEVVLVFLLVLSSSNTANLRLQDLNSVPQNYPSLSRTLLLLNVLICECSKMPWNNPENCWDRKFQKHINMIPIHNTYFIQIIKGQSNIDTTSYKLSDHFLILLNQYPGGVLIRHQRILMCKKLLSWSMSKSLCMSSF